MLAGLRDSIANEARSGWRRRIARLKRPAWLGTLRRTAPLSAEWGYDRGTPIDRYYIERFLDEHRADIQGRVLEVRDRTYTDRFGQNVTESQVLDLNRGNPRATLIADLTHAPAIPSESFDCLVITQTLQFIYDTRAAVAEAYRILHPGGVLLVTVPTISRIAPRYGLKMDQWRFTPASCAALFGDVFGRGQVTVRGYGNVLAAISFLSGLAKEELKQSELNVNDEYFPLIVGVRAVKPERGELPHEQGPARRTA
jgi:SAM-dependent methyltransferase